MFGYIKPFVPELKVKEYDFYRSVYCGLCRALGRSASFYAEFTLSYDFVFLALVSMALNGDGIIINPGRCAVHPIKKRPMTAPNASLERAARAGLILNYYKLADDVSDSCGPKKLVPITLLPAARHIKRGGEAELPGLEAKLAEKLKKLGALEKQGCPSPDAAAEAFGEALAVIFEGVCGDGAKGRIGAEIGFHAGKWIYFTDAADDLEKDRKRGNYNPFLICADGAEPEKDKIKLALTRELMEIEKAVNLIGFDDAGVGALIKNIIYLGMPRVSDMILNKNKNKIGPESAGARA